MHKSFEFVQNYTTLLFGWIRRMEAILAELEHFVVRLFAHWHMGSYLYVLMGM